ncbi:MAG TPA: rhamnulokinase family protein [Gaiellaceae bacterium]|jgi:rhamnulokinase
MRTFAAVDLGAQSGRVAVGRFDGERLAVEEVHRFANVPVRVRGTLHWDVLRLYGDVLDGLRAAARDVTVESVAVDSWGVDFGLLDRAGRLVQNPVHYRDSRRAAAVDGVYARIGARALYDRTGIQLLPINTVFELAAMAAEADPVLAAADRLLLMPDLFHHWLCGSVSTEFTNATTTQCFDAREGAWAVDLLERLDVPTRLLPEVVDAGTTLGPVTDEESGVAGATVIAAATHDTGSAFAGTPFGGGHAAVISVGTWSLVGIESGEPVLGDAAFRANMTNEGGVGGTFRVLRNVTGLWLLEECRRHWGRGVDELLADALDAQPFCSFIDPNDPVFAAPGDMPARVVDYCDRTSQPHPGTEGAVVRCILESLALKHAESVELLARVTGRSIDELHIVGGGAKNELLCEWTAAAAERPVHAGPAEATLVGNLLVQAIALGDLASITEAREVVRRSFAPRVYEPSAGDAWREACERFAALSNSRPEVVTT